MSDDSDSERSNSIVAVEEEVEYYEEPRQDDPDSEASQDGEPWKSNSSTRSTESGSEVRGVAADAVYQVRPAQEEVVAAADGVWCKSCSTMIYGLKKNRDRHLRTCEAKARRKAAKAAAKGLNNEIPKLPNQVFTGDALTKFQAKPRRKLKLGIARGRFTPDPVLLCPNTGCNSRARGATPAFTLHDGRKVEVSFLDGVCPVACPIFYCCHCERVSIVWHRFGMCLTGANSSAQPDRNVLQSGGNFL